MNFELAFEEGAKLLPKGCGDEVLTFFRALGTKAQSCLRKK